MGVEDEKNSAIVPIGLIRLIGLIGLMPSLPFFLQFGIPL